MRQFIRDSLTSVLRLLLAAAIGVGAAISPALAANPTIESITVKWRDAVLPDSTSALPDAARAALSAALRMPFIEVGRARDGAFRLDLPGSLSIDEARAAINRLRMLPQVLYADIEEQPSRLSENASVQKASPGGPPIRRMIVKYRDAEITEASHRNNPLPAFLAQRLSAMAGQPIAHERAMSGGAFVVKLFELLPLGQAKSLARYLETDPAIEYAEPDLLKHPSVVPNDALFASQWHYMSPAAEPGGTNLPAAWEVTTGATAIVTAVLDTGHLPAHPDLAGRFVVGYDFIGDVQVANDGGGRDADPTDPGDWITSAENASGYFEGCGARNSSFHGSHVAGTIGAASNNGSGVAGVNWISKILPVRVLGKCGGYTSDIADAIRWSVGIAVPGLSANTNPARVLNLSFGGYACDGNGQNCACDNTSQNAINAAINAGAAVVVAAGNGNASAIEESPANCNGVITVAATGRSGQRASYSNYGALVEISAPGGSDGSGVLSTLNNGATSPNPTGYTYAWYQGTSMATPHVAGIASLILSVNPSLTPSQVLAMIQTTARAFPIGTGRDCTTALCGAGIIDAAAAVLAAANAAARPTTTTLTSSANPATSGASVAFTATVTGTAPSGTVNFADGGASIAGCDAVALTGTGNTRTAGCSTNALPVGSHSIVANYSGDAANAASASTPLAQAIDAPPSGGSNVALASVGAVASASSSYSGGYPVAAINNNERTGAGWGSGGGWNDATVGAFPDWVQINFNGTKTIDRVVVYTLQDNYASPIEPSDTLTFSAYGVTDFMLQAWNGSAWVTFATVTGNNLVKRTVTFPAVTTDRIRVHITNARDGYSRITEIAAWGVDAPTPPSGGSNVALASVGAVASASSSYSGGYPVAAINNNERTGAGWGSGGGWNDATVGAFPDWVQINFNGTKTIDRVVVYTLQDNYASPIEPSDTLTFSAYGVTDFMLQAWNGSAWVTFATVTGNNLVKRTVTFPAVTTDRIRVHITNARDGYSRITEIAAWGVDAPTPPSGGSNVALASVGAVASASSSYSGGYPVAAINNNERTGAGWGSGGGWNDATVGAFPDWVQINFNGTKTIDRVVVYTLQDNYASPIEPSDTLTFSAYGVTDFMLQAWNGSAWVTFATVTGNNLVKRTVTFPAVTTDRIRVHITNARDGYSRITEIAAWGS
ncbi:MAG: S8 family serine peptidase [Casimicrobiaceae bacterium]